MACKIGLFNSVPSPLLCEMFGHLGHDFTVLDLEHVLRSPAELEHTIRACELGGGEAWMRVAEVDAKLIGRMLDAGPRGVVLAGLDSAEQAECAVAAAHFPSHGRRGICSGRVTGFGSVALADCIECTRHGVAGGTDETKRGRGACAAADPGTTRRVAGDGRRAEPEPRPAADSSAGVDAVVGDHCCLRLRQQRLCPNPRDPARRQCWLAQPNLQRPFASEERALLQAALGQPATDLRPR
ncbi:4-hydroxy-2-oxovalerate aldolase [Xanthomonas cerealis pv. cerealis]|nr:4-hydroxy-2-oxovalerate aldolase [Xanthomonas translucens pv. pistacia]